MNHGRRSAASAFFNSLLGPQRLSLRPFRFWHSLIRFGSHRQIVAAN